MSGKDRSAPNLSNYESARHEFSWEKARQDLEGLPGGRGLNIAHEAVDRHAADALADRVALRYLGVDGRCRDCTYGQLSLLSSRFANLLTGLGVGPGQTVSTLLGPLPEVFVTAMGSFKMRGVFCPLFSAYGPEPLRARLSISQATLLVTTRNLYLRKIRDLRNSVPSLKHVLIVDANNKPVLASRKIGKLSDS